MWGLLVAVVAVQTAAACSRAPIGSGPEASTSALPPSAGADGPWRVASERSQYGRFDETPAASTGCRVSFHHTSGKVTQLFEVSDCGGQTPGIDDVEASARVGALAFPALAPNGDEFHLFEIATARGGNALPGSDYWVVVVRSDSVWSTAQAFADGALLVASLLATQPPSLLLEAPATTTETGARYTVGFGSVSKTALPMLPSSIVSKTTRVFVGELEGGFHYTSWRPSITEGKTQTIIDEDGPCSLPALGEPPRAVRLTAEVTARSDGRTIVKCLSVK